MKEVSGAAGLRRDTGNWMMDADGSSGRIGDSGDGVGAAGAGAGAGAGASGIGTTGTSDDAGAEGPASGGVVGTVAAARRCLGLVSA
jgi:hypothetical protein